MDDTATDILSWIDGRDGANLAAHLVKLLNRIDVETSAAALDDESSGDGTDTAPV